MYCLKQDPFISLLEWDYNDLCSVLLVEGYPAFPDTMHGDHFQKRKEHLMPKKVFFVR
jgi:hypothetical protein